MFNQAPAPNWCWKCGATPPLLIKAENSLTNPPHPYPMLCLGCFTDVMPNIALVVAAYITKFKGLECATS
jgi:hypothetical protein